MVQAYDIQGHAEDPLMRETICTGEQKDLAGKGHWDAIYRRSVKGTAAGWKPVSYDALTLNHLLLKEIDRASPGTILEIGCGNSLWLPYLAKLRHLRVSGMDYSDEGCELARQRLNAEGVTGTIFCEDLFTADPSQIGQYDFVYSLGVVEHFAGLEDALWHMARFVRPGGVLLTEVPNLCSVHGILSGWYQPGQLEKHKKISRETLMNAYRSLALQGIHAEYAGLCSLNIVAWGLNPRFPSADRFVLPVARGMVWATDGIMRRIRVFKGISAFAPFLYAVGTKQGKTSEASCAA